MDSTFLPGTIGRRPLLKGMGAAAALAVAGPHSALAQAGAPDMIVRNARIATMDPARPQAAALAVRGGRFTAVGSEADVMPLAGPNTRIVDGANRVLVPGLNDSHTHTIRGGLNYALELRWDGITSLSKAMDRLRRQVSVTPPGQWVRVVGSFSHQQFAEKRMPTLDELNAAAPDTPVFVLFVYSYALLNKAALRALGIDRNTPDNKWPGGKIERDQAGNPTGLLMAAPSALILYATLHEAARLNQEDQYVSTLHFMRELNRLGVTSTLDCGGGFQNWPEDYGVIRQVHKDGKMTMRIGFSTFIQRPGKEVEDFTKWTQAYKPGEGDSFFRLLGGGEMLVRSAYDFEVFGSPQVFPSDRLEPELDQVVRILAKSEWPFRFHATYEETIIRHLNVLEAIHRDIPVDRLNWIVDHGETLSQQTMERIAALGGGISVQNRIAFQEQEFLDRYGAAKAAEAPPMKKMLEMGIKVAAGTDMSRVSSYNPWLCLEWMVTGKGVGGSQLLSQQTVLDRMTALRLWTDNAWTSREEGEKGRIAPGLLADFALLSDDYFTVPAERIRDITAVLTVVDGNVAWGGGEYKPLMADLPPLLPAWSPVNIWGGYNPHA